MLYDCHTHTLHSHDSAAPVNGMCAAAIQAGLGGLAVTDHCDCEYALADNVFQRISGSVSDTARANSEYGDRLKVMCGVEVGDALFDPGFAEKITSAFCFDVILGSVHAVRSQKNDSPFSRIDFSDWSETELDDYIKQYFSDVYDTLQNFDFDVLSHLTVPFRYINEKHNKNMDAYKYSGQIREILQETIRLGKVLEINTQGVTDAGANIHPDEAVIDLYISLGGRAFCLGSDAHTPAGVANGLQYAANMLRRKGINELFFFENRKRISYPI